MLRYLSEDSLRTLINNSNRTKWSPIRFVIIQGINKWLNWMTTKGESDLSVTSMITNRVGQRKVLLPSNHNCYNFRKQQIDLGQICAEETTSTLEIPQLSRISGCCYGYCDQFCDGWI